MNPALTRPRAARALAAGAFGAVLTMVALAEADPAPPPGASAPPAPSAPPGASAPPAPSAAPDAAPEGEAPVVVRLPAVAPAQALPLPDENLPSLTPGAPPRPPPISPDNTGLSRAAAPYFPVSLAILHPLSTNMGASELRTNLGLSLIFGRVGYLEGFQLGLINSTLHEMSGVQLGVASVNEGTTNGLQLGAAFSYADGPLRGVQLSGIFGWATAPIVGVQFSGIANQTKASVRGLQLSALLNVVRGDQWLEGAQIGGTNLGRVRGLQLGGLNISEEVRGLQIGLINVARKIDGLQIGLINITDNLEGESFGVASIPRLGGVHLVAWGSNSLSGNLGVKFLSRYTYSILSSAVHRQDKDTIVAAGLTFGVRFPFLIKALSWSGDLGGYRLFRVDGVSARHDEMVKTRLLVSYEIARHFSLFAGGGAYVSVHGDSSLTSKFGPELCAGLDL
jgi:hypothetical protein